MSPPTRWAVAVKHGVDVNLTRADPTTGRIDLARAPRKTSDFDQNAVEEAIRLREKYGGIVTVVTVGPPAAREALRDSLSLGADEAVLLSLPEGTATDSGGVARALTAYFRTPAGAFDLALFGEGSTDHFSGTVGPRVAALLAIPSLCHVRRLVLDGDSLRAFRDLEDRVEEIETVVPAVVSVGQEINTPRRPTFLSTLKASKKEIRDLPVATPGLAGDGGTGSVTVQEARLPSIPRKRLRVPGADAAAIAQGLVQFLHDVGIDPA